MDDFIDVMVAFIQQIDGWNTVFNLKVFIEERINALFAAPGASIVLGLLLGMRASIPQKLLDDFQQTGLTHILAISGYNITLLITIFGLMARSLGRRMRLIVVLIAIAIFAALTGLSASVVRASLMGGLLVFALSQGRKTDGIQLLLMSAALMVMANPRIVIWDVSFQLSFVATWGLLALMPLWEKWLKRYPPFIAEGLAVTLAATIFTTPVVLYHFGRFSLISPLANVIFLPLIPLIMLFSFVAFLHSLILPGAFLWVGVCWVLLTALIEGVGLVARVPFASIMLPEFPWWAVVLYYVLLWWIIFSRTPKLEPG